MLCAWAENPKDRTDTNGHDAAVSTPTRTPQITRPSPRVWAPPFVLLSALWGSSFLFIKVGIESIPPLWIAWGRLVVGSLILLLILAVQRERLPQSRRTWGHIGFNSLFTNAIPFALFAFGEQRISSVLAGLWNATTPLFTVVIAAAMLPDERATVRKVVGLGIGLVGVVVILGPWHGVSGNLVIGSLMCIGAALCYAIGTPYSRRFISGSGATGISLAAAQLMCAAAWLTVTLPLSASPSGATSTSLLAVAALGILGTGFAFSLYWLLVRMVGATTTVTVTYLMPLWSTLLGVSILGESLTWNEPVGAAIVLLGVTISERVTTSWSRRGDSNP
jgi:drug/metabolite transporter (DMT)-like permease